MTLQSVIVVDHLPPLGALLVGITPFLNSPALVNVLGGLGTQPPCADEYSQLSSRSSITTTIILGEHIVSYSTDTNCSC